MSSISITTEQLDAAYQISTSGAPGREQFLAELFSEPIEQYQARGTYDALVTEEFLDRIKGASRYRLSLHRVSLNAGIPSKTMRLLIAGVGLSRSKHTRLLEALLRENVDLEVQMFKALEANAMGGDTKAATTVLEKVFPHRYGTQRIEQKVQSEVKAELTSEDRAKEAKEALKRLRERRKENESNATA